MVSDDHLDHIYTIVQFFLNDEKMDSNLNDRVDCETHIRKREFC